MKKILYVTLLGLFSSIVFGQVSIGKTNVDGLSTLLDFDDVVTNNKGIILPAVSNISTALSSSTFNNNGTFLLDKSEKKIKMYENGIWIELSDEGNTDNLIDNISPEEGEGIIIGAITTAAKGVLVIESEDKAIVLPKISNPHITVKSPYAGMICYDTVSKTMAVFDGKNWNYWR